MKPELLIDLLLLAILAISAAAGARLGLFKSLTRVLSVLLAMVLAAFLATAFSDDLARLLFPYVKEPLTRTLTDLLENLQASQLSEKLAGLEVLGISTQELLAQLQAGVTQSLESFALLLLQAVITLLVYVLGVSIAKWILQKLFNSINVVFKLPLLKQINSIGGAALSLLEAALVLFLVVWLVKACGITYLHTHSEGTYLLRFFLENTPAGLLPRLLP